MTTATPAITGSISFGSLRSADVVPAMLATLGILDAAALADFHRAWPTAVVESLLAQEDSVTYSVDDAESLMWLWNDLTDAIQSLLPKGWYFGSHEGDGSDFGIWEA
jgi:hypothetical protein